MFAAAFYKGVRPGLPGQYNRLVRWWESGDYSHSEILFSDGLSASSSWMDHGVRFKAIDYDPAKWDLILLPAHREPAARTWFEQHAGEPYDIEGQFHFFYSPYRGNAGEWWCSKAGAAALGLDDPWRFGPNLLAVVCRALQPLELCA